MPTGYTAELIEKGMPFDQFVLSCARAFGACIELRDEKFGPAPRKIERNSQDDYHAENLKRAKKELKCFTAMSKKEQEAWASSEREASIADAEAYLKKNTEENERLSAMRKDVEAWTPPTNDHEGLKKFMLEQIDMSFHDPKYSIEQLESAKNTTLAERIKNRQESLEWNIEYHEKHINEDAERTDSRDQWLEDLYVSLGK